MSINTHIIGDEYRYNERWVSIPVYCVAPIPVPAIRIPRHAAPSSISTAAVVGSLIRRQCSRNDMPFGRLCSRLRMVWESTQPSTRKPKPSTPHMSHPMACTLSDGWMMLPIPGQAAKPTKTKVMNSSVLVMISVLTIPSRYSCSKPKRP